VQATPGQTANTWFKADEVGTYSGASTVFSGTSYPAMRSWVKVVTTPEYEAYIQDLSDQIHQAQDTVLQDEPPAATE
jgi:heme/copper-type cytochrome/quinol oxidase subunit 2